jgi:hypothetical protein
MNCAGTFETPIAAPKSGTGANGLRAARARGQSMMRGEF